MNTSTLRRAARIEYAVLRLPLDVVDQRVVQRFLDVDSPARQSFERALRTLDDAVGQWLDEPSDDAPPENRPYEDAGTPDLSEDEVEQIDTLTDELVEEQQTEMFVGELAEDDELRRVQAELQAKRLVEEQDEQR